MTSGCSEEIICKTTGLTLTTLRTVSTILFGSDRESPPEFTVGESFLLTLWHVLCKFGFTTDKSISICVHFKNAILDRVPEFNRPYGKPNLFMIQDGRWVRLEGEEKCLDLDTQLWISQRETEPPAVFCGVGLRALFRKMLSTYRHLREEEEAALSVQTSS